MNAGRIFFHHVDHLSPSLQAVKELKRPVGHMVCADRSVVGVHRGEQVSPSAQFQPLNTPGNPHLRLPDGRSQYGRHRPRTGQETVYRPAAPLRAHGLAASAGYQILVSGSRDRTAVVWDLSRLTFIRQLGGHNAPLAAIDVNDLTSDLLGNVTPPLVHPLSRPSSNRWPPPPQKNRKKSRTTTTKRPCPPHCRSVCILPISCGSENEPGPDSTSSPVSTSAEPSDKLLETEQPLLRSSRSDSSLNGTFEMISESEVRESAIHQTAASLIPSGPLNPQQPGVVKKSRHVLKEGPSIRLRLLFLI